MSQYVHPQPGQAPRPMEPQQERTWAAAAHAVPLVAFVMSAGTLGFIASLAIYLIYRDRGPFVRMHAVNSLNAQLSILLYSIVSIVLAVIGVLLLVVIVGIVPLLLGIVGLVASAVLLFWVHVVGAIRAWDGQPYQPPFTIRFIR